MMQLKTSTSASGIAAMLFLCLLSPSYSLPIPQGLASGHDDITKSKNKETSLEGSSKLKRALNQVAIQTIMPSESSQHEGTWLAWPHSYEYGIMYQEDLEPTWVAMTKHLATSERVHIIAYNSYERNWIQSLLSNAGVDMNQIDFVLYRTNDVWIRDNGPLFVYTNDSEETLQVADFGFNGWGYDAPYRKDNQIPRLVADDLRLDRINLNDVILEGGAIEVDGHGTLMATRSAVMENGRNQGLDTTEMEAIMKEYLGAEQVIWLDGAFGGLEDITDTHIDGFARFVDNTSIVTMNHNDLLEWGISQADIDRLYSAKDVSDKPYEFVQLPLTVNDVTTTYGENLGYRGSYVNYYVANRVVLVPAYQDPNDSVARDILQGVFPSRTVVSIDNRNLFANGGMVHCVTMQEPL